MGLHRWKLVFTSFKYILSFWAICLSAGCNNKSEAIRQQINPWKGELEFLFNTGKKLLQDQPDKAKVYFDSLASQSLARGFDEGVGVAYIYLGELTKSKGDGEGAFAFYKKALPYCLKAKYIKETLPVLYINLGSFLGTSGDYLSANSYFLKALEYLLKHSPNDENIAAVYNNLSVIQFRMGQFDQSFRYAAAAEVLVRKNHLGLPLLSTTLNVKGDALIALDRKEEARHALEEALYCAQKANILVSQQAVLCSQGDLMLRSGNNKGAIKLFKEAMKVSTVTDPFCAFILPGYKLGEAYLRTGNYEEAKKILRSAIRKADETGQHDQQITAHATLAAVYTKTKEYRLALEQQEIVLGMKDILFNQEKVSSINEMDIKFKTMQKDKNIAEGSLRIMRQESKLAQKNIQISIIFCFLIMTIGLLLHIFRVSRQKRLSQEKQIYILQQQHELLLQESQISHMKHVMQGQEQERVRIARELHDGIVSQLMGVRLHFTNALQDAVPHLPNPTPFTLTLGYLEEATRELRITAHNLMPETILQGGLIAAIHSYCYKLSAPGGISIHFQAFGNYHPREPETELSLYRIIQELIQNALKHSQAVHILVEINEEEEILSLMVEDDGIGFSEPEMQAKGFGLKSIYDRIQTLNGRVQVTSEAGIGTTFQIDFTHLPFS